jgi:hypothetical protein
VPTLLASNTSDADTHLDRVSRAVRTRSDSVGTGTYAVLTGGVVGGEQTDGIASFTCRRFRLRIRDGDQGLCIHRHPQGVDDGAA